MSVLVCGNVVLDILARPVTDVRFEATTLVENIERQLGGNAGSTSATLARLGCPVSLVTLVGRDDAGETVLRWLREAGVNLDLVQRVQSPTSTAIALVRPNGERALLYHLGAAAEPFAPYRIPPGITHFHLAAVYRMPHLRKIAPELLEQARAAGLTTSLDAQWDTEGEWMKVLRPSLSFTDYTLLNRDEARHLTGSAEPETAAAVLRDHGATHVIIKLGAKGCWADGVYLEGYTVDAIDTTGAGDCFSGAFIAALQRGSGVTEAARFANAVGALAVRKIGATAGVLDWAATVAWMNARHPVSPA